MTTCNLSYQLHWIYRHPGCTNCIFIWLVVKLNIFASHLPICNAEYTTVLSPISEFPQGSIKGLSIPTQSVQAIVSCTNHFFKRSRLPVFSCWSMRGECPSMTWKNISALCTVFWEPFNTNHAQIRDFHAWSKRVIFAQTCEVSTAFSPMSMYDIYVQCMINVWLLRHNTD